MSMGVNLTIASPNLITFTHIHYPASTDTPEWVVEMTHPAIRSGDAAMNTIQAAQERFVEVAYPRTLKAAHKAFKSWHEPKRQDAVQECMAKMWDQWVRLVNRGKKPRAIAQRA